MAEAQTTSSTTGGGGGGGSGDESYHAREQEKFLPTANIARIMKKVNSGNSVPWTNGLSHLRIGFTCQRKNSKGRQGYCPRMCFRVCEFHNFRSQRQVPT